MGHIHDPRIIANFLDEHLHPDHFGHRTHMHSEDAIHGGRGVAGAVDFGPEDVVLVAPSDPPEMLVQNVLQSSHYGGKVRYFKGSIMSTRDLHMMQLRSAAAVFLLSDLHSPDPKAEDARTVVSALILRDFDSEAKIDPSLLQIVPPLGWTR